jgi:hypothetical protein
MTMKEFSKFTSLSPRQIQYAEGGIGNVSDVVVTVYAAKTSVDYGWLATGAEANESPTAPDNASSLLGMDSNHEPIGSLLSLPISTLMKDILLPYLGTPCIKIKQDPLPLGLAA